MKHQPLSPRSGVVRHSDAIVALRDALELVPKVERVNVMIEHDQTGVSTRTTWNRLAVCVALNRGSTAYGIFETVDRARKEGFGLVTRHPSLPHQFLFVDTKPVETAKEVAP